VPPVELGLSPQATKRLAKRRAGTAEMSN